MSRTFFVLFSGMAAFFASSAQASDLEAVQKAIQEAWGRHSSMTARMRMESHRAQGDAVYEGRGEGIVEVLRKGSLYVQRKEVHTEMTRTAADPQESAFMPYDATIILDGESEYLIRGSGDQKFYTKVPVNPGMSVVPQTVIEFLGQSAELKALPEQTIDDQKVWVIEGVRSEPNPKTKTLRTVLYFLQDSGALRRQEEFDAAGVKLETIDYVDFQFDVELDPQRFVLELPPGARLIDKTQKRTPTTGPATQPGEAAGQPIWSSPIRGYLGAPASQPSTPAPSTAPSSAPAAPVRPDRT
jgi:outer membrane lipoprotein-sorting protein